MPLDVADGYGIPVDLVHTQHATSQRRALREDAIIVTVTHDGKVYLGGRHVNPEDLPGGVMAKLHAGSPGPIYIKADARSRYGRMKVVLDALRDAGIDRIVLLTDNRRPT